MYEALVVLLLAGLYWFISPYLNWYWLSSKEAGGRALEAHVGKTSWQFEPGQLVAPAGKAPEVSLSVVVPAFNEESRLPQMLDEALGYLDSRVAAGSGGFSYEVLVVDDGSSDDTFAAALGSRARGCRGEVRAMRLSQNQGKGFAVKAGMLAARGRLLLMADADGATCFRDLERLEQAMGKEDGNGAYQIAFGSRHHLKDQALAKRKFVRNILMVSFHFVVWLLVGPPVCGTLGPLRRRGAPQYVQAFRRRATIARERELLVVQRRKGIPVTHHAPVTFLTARLEWVPARTEWPRTRGVGGLLADVVSHGAVAGTAAGTSDRVLRPPGPRAPCHGLDDSTASTASASPVDGRAHAAGISERGRVVAIRAAWTSPDEFVYARPSCGIKVSIGWPSGADEDQLQ
ncbi:unnamed protein product [Prorocentrum cordatum]|uniref:Glycosyltransferase 2-like domain-containing protein n=1 Tax=Prorocentrum cordatum TaxID=2364126 RepID=A0ABN9XI42_9DINO|nr:unnamed protein product [Polarella glacialis]